MGAENRKKVNNELACLGLDKHKGKSNKSNRGRATANKKNQISQLQASNITHNKTIASLKRNNGIKSDEEDAEIKDAGNSFGGKSKKTKTKF